MIWKKDILPNWDYHWDYRSKKPRGIYAKIRKKEKKYKKMAYINSLRKILPRWLHCLAYLKRYLKKKKHFRKKTRIIKDLNPDQIAIEEINEYKRNHSLLLYMVWKKGIPAEIRTKIWPIAISNNLEITKNLFAFL